MERINEEEIKKREDALDAQKITNINPINNKRKNRRELAIDEELEAENFYKEQSRKEREERQLRMKEGMDNFLSKKQKESEADIVDKIKETAEEIKTKAKELLEEFLPPQDLEIETVEGESRLVLIEQRSPNAFKNLAPVFNMRNKFLMAIMKTLDEIAAEGSVHIRSIRAKQAELKETEMTLDKLEVIMSEIKKQRDNLKAAKNMCEEWMKDLTHESHNQLKQYTTSKYREIVISCNVLISLVEEFERMIKGVGETKSGTTPTPAIGTDVEQLAAETLKNLSIFEKFRNIAMSGATRILEGLKLAFEIISAGIMVISPEIIQGILLVIVTVANMWFCKDNDLRLRFAVQGLLGIPYTFRGIVELVLIPCTELIGHLVAKVTKRKSDEDITIMPMALGAKLPAAQGFEETVLAVEKIWDILVKLFVKIFSNGKSEENQEIQEEAVAQGRLDKGFLEMCKNISTVKGAVSGIEYLAELTWKAVSYAFLKIRGVPLTTDETKKLIEKAVDWMKKANELNKSVKPGQLAQNATLCMKILTHDQDREQLEIEVVEAGYTRTNFTPFFTCARLFRETALDAAGIINTAGTRVPPDVIHIAGPPGLGKSVLTNFLIRDLWPYYCELNGLPKEKAASNFWERKPMNEHWDGYSGQFCVTVDDAFQHDDEESITRLALETIWMTNTAPYPLLMANCEAKKNTYFNSPAVIMNSNLIDVQGTRIQWPGHLMKLTNKNAFYRRIGTNVMMRRADDFDINSTEMQPKYEFKYCLPTGEPEDGAKWETYQTFIDDIAYKMKQRHENIKKMTAGLEQPPMKITPKPRNRIALAQGKRERTVPVIPQPRVRIPVAQGSDDENNNNNDDERGTDKTAQELAITLQGTPDDSFVTIARGYYYNMHLDKLGSYGDNTILHYYRGRYNMYHFKGHAWAKVEHKGSYAFVLAAHIYQEHGNIIDTQRARRAAEFALLDYTKEKVTGTLLTGVCMIASGIGVAVLAIKLLKVVMKTIKGLFGRKQIQAHHEGGSIKPSGMRDVIIGKRKPVVKGPRQFSGVAVSHGAAVDQATMDIGRMIKKNTAKLYFTGKGKDSRFTCGGVFVFDRVLQAPKHMLTSLESQDGTKLEGTLSIDLCTSHGGVDHYEFDVRELNIKMDDIDDVAYIQLPKTVQPFMDLTPYFIREKDLEEANISSTSLIIHKPGQDSIARESCNTKHIPFLEYKLRENGPLEFSNYHTIKYEGSYQSGDCGFLVVLKNTHVKEKLLGFHIAGYEGAGFANTTPQEFIKQVRQIFLNEENEVIGQGFEEILRPSNTTEVPLLEYPPGIEFIGKVKPEFGTRLPEKSVIRPSLICSVLQKPISAPAPLVPFTNEEGKRISPLELTISRFQKGDQIDNKLDFEYDEELLIQAIVDSIPCTTKWRRLTISESINGVLNSKFIRALHLDTAAGHTKYLKKPKGAKGKGWCFTGREGQLELKPELQREYDEMEQAYERGETGQMIQTACLKDERRLIEKVKAGSARLYYLCQLVHLVMGRRDFCYLIENILESWTASGIAIGINPASFDWRDVIETSRETNTIRADADVKSADFPQRVDIQRIVEKALFRWIKINGGGDLQEKDFNRMRGCLSDVTQTITMILCKDLIKVKCAGLSSGCFITALLQSLHYQTVFRIAAIQAVKRNEQKRRQRGFKFDTIKQSTIIKNIKTRNTGDDTLINILSEIDFINFKDLVEETKKMGYTVTPGNKSDIVPESMEISEMRYLKRGFRLHNSIWFAPIDTENILEVLNWVREGELPEKDQLRQNAEWAVLEFGQHGRKVFEFRKKQINQLLVENNIEPIDREYDEILANYLKKTKKEPYVYSEMDSPIAQGKEDKITDIEDIGKDTIKQVKTYSYKTPRIFTQEETKKAAYYKDMMMKLMHDGLKNEGAKAVMRITIESIDFKDYIDDSWGELVEIIEFNYDTIGYFLKNHHKDMIKYLYQFDIEDPIEEFVRLRGPIEEFTNFERDDVPIVIDGESYSTRRGARAAIYTYLKFIGQYSCIVDSNTFIHMYQFRLMRKLEEYRIANFEKGINMDGKWCLLEEDIEGEQHKKLITFINVEKHLRDNKIKPYVWPIAQMEKEEVRGGEETVVTGLTTVDDIKEIEEAPVKSKIAFFRRMDPYPPSGLTELLSRKYQLATITWSSASVPNALVGTYVFPQDLMVQPRILSALQQFQYLNCDRIRLEFRVSGTVYHYGKLMIAALPYTSESCWKYDSIYTMSDCDAITLSPGQNNTVAMTVPYVSPHGFWDRTEASISEAQFCSVVVRVLNPLSAVNATSTITLDVSVWASFENPQTAGPSVKTTFPAPMSKKKQAVAQMKREQKSKSEQGIVTQGLDAMKGIATFAKKVPLISTYADVGEKMLNTGSRISSFFGLDKPNSLETTKPVQMTTVNSMSNAKGLNTLSDLAMDPQNVVGNEPDRYGLTEHETNLSTLAQRPGLYYTSYFDNTAAVGHVIHKFHVSPNTAFCIANVGETSFRVRNTPLSMVAYMHRYWRGSIKYLIQISASQFHQCRLRVSWHPTFGEIPSDFVGEEADVVSKVFEVKGDTLIEFTIPYLKSTIYSYCGDVFDINKPAKNCNGGIAISIVNPVTSVEGTVNMKVYYNIYLAGGKDFEVRVPEDRAYANREIKTDADSGTWHAIAQGGEEIAQPSNVLLDAFKRDFPTLVPAEGSEFDKICFGETSDSILDLLHRYEFFNNFTLDDTGFSSYIYLLWPAETLTGGVSDVTLNIARYWFLFNCGGFNYKIIRKSTSPCLLQVCNMYDHTNGINPNSVQQSVRLGQHIEDMTYKPSAEISIPYASKFPFRCNITIAPASYEEEFGVAKLNFQMQDATANLQVDVYSAVRDDFSLGWARGPPVIQYTLPAVEKKEKTVVSDNNNNKNESGDAPLSYRRSRLAS